MEGCRVGRDLEAAQTTRGNLSALQAKPHPTHISHMHLELDKPRHPKATPGPLQSSGQDAEPTDHSISSSRLMAD